MANPSGRVLFWIVEVRVVDLNHRVQAILRLPSRYDSILAGENETSPVKSVPPTNTLLGLTTIPVGAAVAVGGVVGGGILTRANVHLTIEPEADDAPGRRRD
jgi:hypothetical protein